MGETAECVAKNHDAAACNITACHAAPMVSVVVPNYNYARYLKGRLDTILGQTYSDFELILLDDASTDESVDVLRRYADARVKGGVRIVVNETNTGSPFKQWVKGIRLARGKYVWIAEADDLADADFLSTCVAKAEEKETTALCYVGSCLLDANGKISKKDINHWGWKRVRLGISRFEGADFVRHNLYWKNYVINASGVLFRREYALTLCGTRFEEMRYSGDWLFWCRMAMQGDVVEIYRRHNYFRQHAAKVTVTAHDTGNGILEDIQVIAFIEDSFPTIGSYKRSLRRGRVYRAVCRLHVDTDRQCFLLEQLRLVLGGSKSDYKTECRNQWQRLLCPWLLTCGRDRL